MAKIGIIGWGVVGQAIGAGFENAHEVFWYDKYKEGPFTQSEVIRESEFIFICVPTPMFEDFSGQDTSVIEGVVSDIAPHIEDTDTVLVIKSTVLPGTTAKLIEKFPRVSLAMNPEFLTEKRPAWDFAHPDRTIIGASSEKIAERIKEVYEKIYPDTAKYFLTDPTTAELAKFASNTLLAVKVMAANEIHAVATGLKVNYEDVREMIEADPRMGGHLKVPGPDGDAGFGGKCLPKDMVGFLQIGKDLGVDLSVMRAVWEKNLKVRKNYDWEKIDGATTKVGKVD